MCIFCKILSWEIPCYKIRENEKFIAILDVFPNCVGQTLVISKQHYDSDLFTLQDKELYKEVIYAVDEVIQLLKKKLEVQRVGVIIEWMGVNHLHIKLYPMHWLHSERVQKEEDTKMFFTKYPGYLTTQGGEQADFEDLAILQRKIQN